MPRFPFLIVLPCLVAGLFATARAATEPAPPRERVSFNTGWRFTKGDPTWLAAQIDYAAIRKWMLPTGASLLGLNPPRPARPPGNFGADIDYVRPAFDDSAWQPVTLPHDWAITGPFKQEYPSNTGKLPWWGIGWYRKHFSVPAGDAQHYTLEIDGAMACSTVWLNGQFVGGWAYGYTSYQLDLTPYLRPGADNVIAIRLDNPPDSSRWYPGAGLYRNIWLTTTGPVRVAQWGVTVTTPRISSSAADVSVQVQTDNLGDSAVAITVRAEVYELDEQGQKGSTPVAANETPGVEVASRRNSSATQNLVISRPRLWSIDHPQRYVAVTSLVRDGRVLDRVETPFGVRTAVFDADRGFLLNGQPIRIQGVCLHHDLGALGTAINTRAIERQLEILRSMGCNAIRTSHNPPSPEMLDACDRLGFLVMDEAFDIWGKGKTRQDYHLLFADWHEQDLRALIRRDRNHPSVVIWSIGNEIIEQWGDDGREGWKLAAHLAGIVREEDRTRTISGAFNGEQSGYNGFQHVLDAIGYNYRTFEYARFRRINPTVPLFGAETASTVSSRGEYFFPVSDDKLDPAARANFQISSYDLAATPWASTPETEWSAADGAPGYAGEFVWTGFDYLGEPTPYDSDATNLLNFSDPAARARMAKELAELGKINVPSRSSYFGIVDLAGFPKDRFYLYQSRWRADLPMAHILPHWTWPERAGLVTPVHVYTSGDEAELFINGRSLGRKVKAAGAYRLRWDDVHYEPGELKVVAYKNGRPWAEDVMRTAGAAARLALSVDRANLRADGLDLAYISVAVTDEKGTLAPRAANLVRFTLTGPGEIIATDNGDATSFESFQAPQHHAYNGRVLVIVRTRAGQAGPFVLHAESDGLAPAKVSLQSTTPH